MSPSLVPQPALLSLGETLAPSCVNSDLVASASIWGKGMGREVPSWAGGFPVIHSTVKGRCFLGNFSIAGVSESCPPCTQESHGVSALGRALWCSESGPWAQSLRILSDSHFFLSGHSSILVQPPEEWGRWLPNETRCLPCACGLQVGWVTLGMVLALAAISGWSQTLSCQSFTKPRLSPFLSYFFLLLTGSSILLYSCPVSWLYARTTIWDHFQRCQEGWGSPRLEKLHKHQRFRLASLGTLARILRSNGRELESERARGVPGKQGPRATRHRLKPAS